ncbi:D-2-hydroxyacid dehydrogenase [Parendozoicomonas haliclonae]|uniref:Glycerate dehydrogenase n=1 Tax=Parendozoicomonas haliclonae TaxID=1960125 RepID=A0A1X7AGD4_9GAMM|nr:D-2-hydroxyacid dehydrogenase [Parendozoicomonas haliclonae]SMA38595.1 Glycerate dehydrogenase [Parendozoicomonas haliclonae]
MQALRGVILDRMTLGDDLDLSPILNLDIDWTVYDHTEAQDVVERIQGANIVLCNKCNFSRDVIEAATSLKFMGLFATGYNNIDIEAARDNNIAVTNIRAYCTPSVTQHTLSLMLALSTHLPRYSRISTDGTWTNSQFFSIYDSPIMELAGKTLLIVGYGELGRSVARVAESLGMNILVARTPGSSNHSDDRVELEDGLKQADVVSLHCPLTDQTRNMIAAPQLALMKPHALLINTARGGMINEQDLADALKQGIVGGAGIDVLTEEPPVNGNPLLDPEIPNLILTPHSAWAAKEARERAVQQVANNLTAFMKGEQLNRVDLGL